MELKSTQTITKTERSGSTSIVRGESGEYGQEHHHPLDINNATPHAVPGRLDAHVYHFETDSRTSTVTHLPSAFTRSFRRRRRRGVRRQFTQYSTNQSGVILPLLMLPGISGTAGSAARGPSGANRRRARAMRRLRRL